MLLLRTTSIAGLVTTLASFNTSITGNVSAIAIINNPDETVVGSLAKVLKDGKDYADANFANIDLSQIDLNKAAIALLNNPDATVDGSIAKSVADAKVITDTYADAKKTEFVNQLTPIETNITIINGDSTVEGSISKAVADLINGSPESLNTLKEIADQLGLDENASVALANTVSSNKTAIENALQAHVDIYNANVITVNDKFTSERTITTNDIATAINNYNTLAEGKFFQLVNLFSEVDTDAKKATARTNLGVVSYDDVVSYGASNKDLFKIESFTITNGIIALNDKVTKAHIERLIIPYPGNEFDTPVYVNGDSSGEFKIYDVNEGDLDGVDVQVKYVQQRL